MQRPQLEVEGDETAAMRAYPPTQPATATVGVEVIEIRSLEIDIGMTGYRQYDQIGT